MDVQESVWNGAINTKIILEEASGSILGTSFLLLVYRNSYFPLYFGQIIGFFNSFTQTNLNHTPVWLEFEGVPLKWNIPVGVLYDLLFLPSLGNRSPWVLTLKYQDSTNLYPSEHLIPFPKDGNRIDYVGMLGQVVLNLLKQSCYVMNGNSRAMMSLSEEHSRALWKAISLHDYTVFHAMIRKLNRTLLQRIPMKVYLAGSSTLMQAPVTPVEDNEPVTLRKVLCKWMPDFFGDKRVARAYAHGIDLDVLFDVSLLEVWTAFRHLDNFLYVVVALDQE